MTALESNSRRRRNYVCTFLYAACRIEIVYNTNVFMFGDSDLRKLMADIQVEEQNHAEMLYKYKTANGMQ